jgi:hypothetical protein
MSDLWYCVEDGQQLGPVQLADLKRVVSTTANAESILVWTNGFPDWKRAADVKELASIVRRPPPIPSKQSAIQSTVFDLQTKRIARSGLKRGFLFGLGSFLILGVIAGLSEFATKNDIIMAVMALFLMPLSVVTVRAAKGAPPNRSRLHAIFGWLFGFLVIDVVILACVGVILLSRTA